MLTLANAAVVLRAPAGRAALPRIHAHHAPQLAHPSRRSVAPNPDEPPHIVKSIDHYNGRLTLTDQDGNIYHYPSDGLIATAVADSIKVITRCQPMDKTAPPTTAKARISRERNTADDNDGRGPPQHQ